MLDYQRDCIQYHSGRFRQMNFNVCNQRPVETSLPIYIHIYTVIYSCVYLHVYYIYMHVMYTFRPTSSHVCANYLFLLQHLTPPRSLTHILNSQNQYVVSTCLNCVLLRPRFDVWSRSHCFDPNMVLKTNLFNSLFNCWRSLFCSLNYSLKKTKLIILTPTSRGWPTALKHMYSSYNHLAPSQKITIYHILSTR